MKEIGKHPALIRFLLALANRRLTYHPSMAQTPFFGPLGISYTDSDLTSKRPTVSQKLYICHACQIIIEAATTGLFLFLGRSSQCLLISQCLHTVSKKIGYWNPTTTVSHKLFPLTSPICGHILYHPPGNNLAPYKHLHMRFAPSILSQIQFPQNVILQL